MKSIYRIIFCLLISNSVFATLYSIEIETQFSNEPPKMARLLARAGELVEYTSDKLKLKILPVMLSTTIVQMQTEIMQYSKGNLRVLAKPNIISYLNNPAEFFQESHDGNENVRLLVIPRVVE